MSSPSAPISPFEARALAATGRLIAALAIQLGSEQALLQEFGFLEAHALDVREGRASDRDPAPLGRLRRALRLSQLAVDLLLLAGSVEDDGRFGVLFEAMQNTPGQHRPTWGFFAQTFGPPAREGLAALRGGGVLQADGAELPRTEQPLRVPLPLWEALRGEAPQAEGPRLLYTPAPELPLWDDLVLPEGLRDSVMSPEVLLLRGASGSGRTALLGARAREHRRGLLVVQGPVDGARWAEVGALAAALNAEPAVELNLAAGEEIALARPPAWAGPIGLVLGNQGAVGGALADAAVTVRVPPPPRALRAHLWTRVTGSETLSSAVARRRVGAGTLARAAQIAGPEATIEQASDALRRQLPSGIETLARRLPPLEAGALLTVSSLVQGELDALRARCVHREELGDGAGPALKATLNPGVRALLHGPSGTGKTLAARVLARDLGLDLYRVDLASIVNKYIGETEKNLERLFAAAEALDVVLLLDEGDALLTSRTAVSNALDRYANLETNYLLQRIETYEGVVLITTNAVERVDSAFQRRMDVVVAFGPPDVAERRSIWDLHLPQKSLVSEGLLDELSARCRLNGAQIRNAALHASLLALNDGVSLDDARLREAVVREYRKLGSASPLRAGR